MKRYKIENMSSLKEDENGELIMYSDYMEILKKNQALADIFTLHGNVLDNKLKESYPNVTAAINELINIRKSPEVIIGNAEEYKNQLQKQLTQSTKVEKERCLRIFENNGKINFVDSNNVFLGYDMDQCCCEHADWFIHNTPVDYILDKKDTSFGEPEEYINKKEVEHNINLTSHINTIGELDGYKTFPLYGWIFDTDYVKYVDNSDDYADDFDDGGMVIFRIINEDKEMFIHLYNCHNGYYCHGFRFEVNGQVIKNEYI